MANVKLSRLKPNPDNPRIIKDAEFYKLVDNILRFPALLRKRPIVHLNSIVRAGNMRLRAIEHIVRVPVEAFSAMVLRNGIDDELLDTWSSIRRTKSIPGEWVNDASDLTAQELEAFVILDNVSFGGWDWDILANSWDQGELVQFGAVATPDWAGKQATKKEPVEEEAPDRHKYAVMVSCTDEKHQQEVYAQLQGEGLTCKIVVV